MGYSGVMENLIFLLPIALCLGGLGLLAFFWALRRNQFDDMEGAANRILFDDDSSPTGGHDQKSGGKA